VTNELGFDPIAATGCILTIKAIANLRARAAVTRS
jgi:hypothetical protein